MPIAQILICPLQNEENIDLQTRSAVAVASFIEFCASHSIVQPPEKIVKNLCTFLCQDTDRTPTFAYTRKVTDGILSFAGASRLVSRPDGKTADKDKMDGKTEDASRAALSRRGACLAFDQLSAKFGPQLLHVIPSMWQSMAGGLLSAFQVGMCTHFPPGDSFLKPS